MAILNNNPLIGSGGQQGYSINNSLRFRSSASASLTRTPSSATNRQKWTYSVWVKRGLLSSAELMNIYYANNSTATYDRMYFHNSNGTFQLNAEDGGSSVYSLVTTQVFRDSSAWYHIVVAFDTTQATSSNRIKLYVNGNQVTAFSTASYPSLNFNTQVNNNVTQYIGTGGAGASAQLFDGYLADVNFIDGSAKTPSDFGETDTITGVWKPKAYTGTYGTNGFYLKFSDIATTSGSNAGLGKDFSGNSNYWTTNNISVTSGTTYDAMTDSPTNTSATVANYCTLNPLRNTASSQGTFSNANLKISGTTGTINCVAAGTMAFSGKMYCEMTIQVRGNNTTNQGVGIVPISSNESNRAGLMSTGIYYQVDGNKRVTGTSSAYGSSYTSGDVIGIAVDTSAETVTFYKNNVSQGSISGTGVISAQVFPYIGFEDSGSPEITANFGQRPFAYTPPTGYVALNTFNLPTPTILQGNKYMNAVLYTGNGSTNAITGVGFSPDFVWVKNRAIAEHNCLYDSVRGIYKQLYSNLTNAEDNATNSLLSFDSDGFTLGNNTTPNTNGNAHVAWNWRGSDSTAVSNTSGSITSTVSVNTTAGFSIVTYTGTGANATVGHGLGVAPSMVIIKQRSNAGIDWIVWHTTFSSTQYMTLNTTAAVGTGAALWNSTKPSSTVISIGTDVGTNQNTITYVAYCWAEIAGFSRFTSYTGNGSADGPFIFLGFRPKFVMYKRTDTTGGWVIIDTSRDTYNYAEKELYPHLSNAENTGSARIDILSNGYKIRSDSTYGYINASGGTYIVAAFAENPFKNSNAR